MQYIEAVIILFSFCCHPIDTFESCEGIHRPFQEQLAQPEIKAIFFAILPIEVRQLLKNRGIKGRKPDKSVGVTLFFNVQIHPGHRNNEIPALYPIRLFHLLVATPSRALLAFTDLHDKCAILLLGAYNSIGTGISFYNSC